MAWGSMKTALGIVSALFLAASAAAVEPVTSKNHAHALSGTVASMDGPGKTLTIRDTRGKETRLVTTSATRVSGGKLEAGAKVTVRWVAREHKNVATAVQVHPPEAERSASTTPSPLAPTPKTP
jgi:hypothetical protein